MAEISSVAHFTLLEPLGAGGMGEVYLARDEHLDRDVAVKLLSPDAASDPLATERFRREARAASAINHPNIVTVYDVGEAEGTWYIAMELVQGQTLARARGTPWPIARAGDVLAQCATALAVAHDAGIVHRDIKPENVMVRGDGYVKLLDFGLARLMPAERTESSRLTEPGKVLGTMEYLSPEQASGELVGAASDVFSLGIVTYELLSGRHPFHAPTQIATLGAILTRDVTPIAALRPEVPPVLQDLVGRMLDKTPERRPRASDVVAVLRDAGLESAGPRIAAVASGDAGPAGAGTGAVVPPALSGHGSIARRSGVVVGRTGDVAAIQAAYSDVVNGQGLLLCVAGEAGIGKTTLIESALGELRAGDAPPQVAIGRCSERLAGTEAYLPVLDALESTLEHDATGAVAALVSEVAPTWGGLLGRGDDAVEDRTALASQERLKREMAALLQRASQRAPVVLFFDDLHWADASTVDLIAYLGVRLDRMRVLLLVTYRDAELRAARHPFLQVQQLLQSRGQARELGVALLSEPDVAEYVNRTYPGNEFPPAFARAVHARSEGSPLFVADVLRWLGTQGVIAERAGRWSLVRPVPDVDHDLPSSVRSMIERKVALVGEADRRLLGAAAVQGAEFDSATVAAVLGTDAADVEEQLIVLDKVYAFVRRIEDAQFPDRTPTVRYRFAHALYQNVLAAELAPSRRASWSRAAADFLEARHGPRAPEIAGMLAALREAARQPERAAAWYAMAAQRAMAVFAYAEAEMLAARGLAQGELIEDAARHVAIELPLRLALGATSLVRRGFAAPETANNMAHARALCDAIGETPSLMPALWVLVLYNIAHGQMDDAATICTQMLQIGRASGDPVLEVCGHLVHVGLNTHRGTLADALSHHAEAAAMTDAAVVAALRARFQPDPTITTEGEYVRLLWLTGRFDEAWAALEAAERHVTGTGDPQGRAFIALFASELALMSGDAERAERFAADGLALCEEHGIASERLWLGAYLGMARAARGDADSGIGLMRASLGAFYAIECFVSVPFFQAHLAAAELAAGHVPEAQQAVDAGLRLAERTGEHTWDAELWRVQAAILDRPPDARADGLTARDARQRARHAAEVSGAAALAARIAADGSKTTG
ncbi:MAG: protein kinase [Gemmatimonadota bacterium]|nr:protein kinase [Gemmatimonadota bacterium]